MINRHIVPMSDKMLFESFGNCDRAVIAACAADCDNDLAFTLLDVKRI